MARKAYARHKMLAKGKGKGKRKKKAVIDKDVVDNEK